MNANESESGSVETVLSGVDGDTRSREECDSSEAVDSSVQLLLLLS